MSNGRAEDGRRDIRRIVVPVNLSKGLARAFRSRVAEVIFSFLTPLLYALAHTRRRKGLRRSPSPGSERTMNAAGPTSLRGNCGSCRQSASAGEFFVRRVLDALGAAKARYNLTPGGTSGMPAAIGTGNQEEPMRYLNPIVYLVAVLSVALPATVACANGIYVGGGVGTATIEDSTANPSGVAFDESHAALKVFGGYRFDMLPIVSLSGEIGYRDLGKPKSSPFGVPVEYSVHGFDYAGLAGVGLGPVEVFARLGGMQYDLEKNIGGTKTSFDGTAAVYGVGARFSVFGLGVRAEYEQIDIKKLDNVRMVSVSVFYQF
jgi:hypothetical protein